jgi:hypothetical protein
MMKKNNFRCKNNDAKSSAQIATRMQNNDEREREHSSEG